MKKIFIIAETSVNHSGDIEIAKDMIVGKNIADNIRVKGAAAGEF